MITQFKNFLDDKLLYLVPSDSRNAKGLEQILINHPQIKFVSLVGVDLEGNDTDEKIPVSSFLENVEAFLSGGVQTDGSSVVLPGIATLNNGKVDLRADSSVHWNVDYNFEHLDAASGLPIGTLRIPSFLIHNGQRVDSRSILAQTLEFVKAELLKLLRTEAFKAANPGFDPGQIDDIIFTSATELEFWVRTPGFKIETEKLATSQILQEQYWKRTKGSVRTALEHSLMFLEKYGLAPEMGHKEVGGVKATVSGDGRFSDIMEQLEIDWKYSNALQTADNELLARITIKEIFRLHGLEVIFMAKPIEGVAGSGEHTHLSIAVKLKDGSIRNLFTAADPQRDFLSPIGWGALMGVLKNYEAIGAFITATNDAFKRLKPGFEAPVCIVASVGHSVETPSRNRTVLAGLVRDFDNPLATRFEVRAPNPHTNTYLALAALYLGALDGIKYAVPSGKSAQELEAEFSKQAGAVAPYLEQERSYRSEADIFEHFGEAERNRLFGAPPATVWEAFQNLDRDPAKKGVLTISQVMTPAIIDSYRLATLSRWITELANRIIPENTALVRSFIKKHGERNNAPLDEQRWQEVQQIRLDLFKDDTGHSSLFARIRKAIDTRDFAVVSTLQREMDQAIDELKQKYFEYQQGLLD
jgi:glutamine synthetase